jgi:hypothetical protein
MLHPEVSRVETHLLAEPLAEEHLVHDSAPGAACACQVVALSGVISQDGQGDRQHGAILCATTSSPASVQVRHGKAMQRV